jgi:hypothetical protein
MNIARYGVLIMGIALALMLLAIVAVVVWLTFSTDTHNFPTATTCSAGLPGGTRTEFAAAFPPIGTRAANR